MTERPDALIVTIITPQGFCSSVEATAVQAKTELGRIEILRNHAPLIALLKPGKVKVTPVGKKKASEYIYVSGSGVIEVSDNKVNVLADNGFFGKDLDEETLRKTEKELRRKIQDHTAEKVNETLEALNEVSEKLKIAEEIKNESTQP